MRVRRPVRLALLGVPLSAALVVLLASTLALGAGPGGPAASITDPAQVCAAPPGASVRVSVPVKGQRARTALLHLPSGRRGRVPLILALHGAYHDGAFMERYSRLSRLGDRDDFAVVYPDARGPFWRLSARAGSADVEFLDAVLDRLLAAGCFDEDRVSAVGVSNGAGMAARFACTGEDRLAGLVAVAGDYGPLPSCRARRPLSVFEIHGTADRVVPYRGTPRNPDGDVVRWLTGWVDRDACPQHPRDRYGPRNVLRFDWTPCRDGTSIAHLRLDGGTHSWPGSDPPDPGPQFGVSAAVEAWHFLRDRRRSPPA